MKKFILKSSGLLLIVGILSAAIFAAVASVKSVYSNSYQRGYTYQYHALEKSKDDKKIIVIGGSYMTFAVDSESLGDMTRIPTYTLGIHSGMGMDYVMETALKFANEGDIIVYSFAPFVADEYGMDLIYLSLDSEPEMFEDFIVQHPFEVLSTAGMYVNTKLYNVTHNFYLRCCGRAAIKSVYDARAFDAATGNLIYERGEYAGDIEDLYFETDLTSDSISNECIDEMNIFSKECEKNGISVYMIYAPFFEEAYTNLTESNVDKYQNFLETNIHIPLISNVEDCMVPLEYIYNGIQHLNDSGAAYYTKLIAEGLEDMGALK